MSRAQPDTFVSRRLSQRSRDQIVAQAQSTAQRTRAEDSWIDIAAHQSTSSLHSNRNHEIITTGLSLPHNTDDLNRASRLQASSQSSQRSTSVAGSSQDEYEESESESDVVLSSSNEEEDEDEDDTSTALGALPGDQHIFTPQPNAFTHPPASNNVQSAPSPDSYFPPVPHVTHSDRLPTNRMVSQRTIAQRQYSRDRISVSRPQPDHDAALRASLTTLLSCAAAVRPKEPLITPPTQRSIQSRTFRLVPGSEIDAAPTQEAKPLRRRRSRESSKERQAKKVKAIRAATVGDELVSPTVMTWMISAGVVLVVSAISFSAGYAWGKDAGRFEGDLSCNSCSKEMIKSGGGSGLRKLRWTSAGQSVRA